MNDKKRVCPKCKVEPELSGYGEAWFFRCPKCGNTYREGHGWKYKK